MTTSTFADIDVRTYEIDPAHSEATFQVRHLLSKVRGRFSVFSGTVELDDANPEASSVAFTIQTNSVDTNQPDRDAHLRSADFFSVDEFPELTFVSHEVSSRGDGRYDVTGALTIRGVTRIVTLPVRYLGKATDPWGQERAAFEVETSLNRSDYGLTWNAALETGGFLVGDEVHISLSLQAVAK
jgi:polyisoprenoid-binding protein YceI